jgi:hypothetical protein
VRVYDVPFFGFMRRPLVVGLLEEKDFVLIFSASDGGLFVSERSPWKDPKFAVAIYDTATGDHRSRYTEQL